MNGSWWTDGSMVNEGVAGDEGFVGDAATPDDANRIVEAHNTRGLTELDAAWAEAEAALPEGWWIHALYAWSFDDMAYRAEAASPGRQIDMLHSASTKRHGTKRFVSGPSAEAYGPTPAAALHALAARLRAATPASGEPAAPCVRVSNPDQGIDSHWCLTHDAEWLLGAARCVARGSAPPAAGAEPPR